MARPSITLRTLPRRSSSSCVFFADLAALCEAEQFWLDSACLHCLPTLCTLRSSTSHVLIHREACLRLWLILWPVNSRNALLILPTLLPVPEPFIPFCLLCKNDFDNDFHSLKPRAPVLHVDLSARAPIDSFEVLLFFSFCSHPGSPHQTLFNKDLQPQLSKFRWRRSVPHRKSLM